MSITKPGVYANMPADQYHADHALSASGARLLLPPNAPALYKWNRDHGQELTTKALDLGNVAHTYVLSEGKAFAVYPEGSLASNGAASTAEAKAWAKEQRANGVIPLKQAELEPIKAMAEEIKRHPIAGRIFAGAGTPEASIFWNDEQGTPRRARLDWLPESYGGRLIIADYKTARSANPRTWVRHADDYGYHLQDANYRAAVAAAGIDDNPAMVFVLQEKTPPYLISVVQLDIETRTLGDVEMKYASRVYAHCTATNHWPGYADEVVSVGLPEYVINTRMEHSYDLAAALAA